jgi:hypothetical protein
MLTEIAGVLGFIFSIFIFVLTRWERKRRLVIQLEGGDALRFRDELDFEEPEDIIILRFINMGGKPIIINMDSLIITSNDKRIRRYDTDWLGMEKIPHPLSPGSCFEVALYKEAFESLLGLKTLFKAAKPEDDYRCVAPISTEVEDIHGHKYRSDKRLKYNYYVSDFG